MNQNQSASSPGPGLLPQSPAAGLVLLVVEGVHDVAFLKCISRMLHTHDPQLPDLDQLECEGRVVFVPTGGGNLQVWAERLAPLPHPQFYLFDREHGPEADRRQAAVAAVQESADRVVLLSSKRSLENYLHRQCFADALDIDLVVNDTDDIAERLARRVLTLTGPPWEQLCRRGRSRLRNRIKKQLHSVVVARMTPALLAARDPEGEVVYWLQTIARLLSRVHPQ